MSKDEAIPLELLNIKVPEGVPKETGFFEISGTEARESVNSRVYAWFLDREKNPVLAPLFCDALLLVAQEKQGDTSVADRLRSGKYKCQREAATSIGKRIDILLDDTDAQLAIIIENKINADLRNNLRDYWNHVSYPETQKIGILLTLHPTEVPDDFKSIFINVTHLEWVEMIESTGVPSGIPLYAYGMMTDFFNTMRSQSTSRAMNDQARFFFDHPALVLKAKKCLEEARIYIRGELEEVAIRLELSPDFKDYNLGYCYLKGIQYNEDTFYTVIFEELLQSKNPTLSVIIELQSIGIKHIERLDEALEVLPQLSTIKRSKATQGRGETKYVHFRAKELSLNTDRISQLSKILIETIQNDFKPMMNTIYKTLNGLTEKE